MGFFFDSEGLYPYYCAPMSQAALNRFLPKHGDARKYAQQGVTLAGLVALRELTHVSEVVLDNNAAATVSLSFGLDEQKKKVLMGTVQVDVELVCQRCLTGVTVPVTCDIALGIVWTEEQAQNLPKTLDPWIVGEELVDLYAVVEEELLLNLPQVAYHQEACVDAALYQSVDAAADKAIEEDSAKNPFQVLEQLKGAPKK